MEQPTQQSFFIRIFRQPPLLYPFVLLFHIVVLIYVALPWIHQAQYEGSFSPVGMLCIGWVLIYFLLWLFSCDLKKWAASAYMIFTALNLALQFLVPKGSAWYEASTVMLRIDILFSFFQLLYYKRFR